MRTINKVAVTGEMTIKTGMHIGTSKDFSPIGAVDSTVIRNPLDYQPIIPGSSFKGKMRSLLASFENPYLTPQDIKDDSEGIKRLFGSSADASKVVRGRLQFYDLKLTEKSREELERADLDLPYTEIKFENSITRGTGVANPRQIERVVAGSVFEFKLIYNVENKEEMEEDFKLLKQGIRLLEEDYLGGSGTRGYGRVKLGKLDVKAIFNDREVTETDLENLKQVLNQEN